MRETTIARISVGLSKEPTSFGISSVTSEGAEKNFIAFVAISVLLEGAGAALAFMKMEGKSIPQFMTSALFFLTKPKTYVWQRKNAKLHLREEKFVNPLTNGEGLQKAELVRNSRVADLAVRVQTKK